MRYPIIIERGEHNYGAYSPDVPGCGATGATIEEVTAEIRAALAFHFRSLAADGDPIPPATSLVATVEVELPKGAVIADAAD